MAALDVGGLELTNEDLNNIAQELVQPVNMIQTMCRSDSCHRLESLRVEQIKKIIKHLKYKPAVSLIRISNVRNKELIDSLHNALRPGGTKPLYFHYSSPRQLYVTHSG